MAVRVAVYGLKHGHIHGVVQTCRKMPNVELVMVAEDDPHYREPAARALEIEVTDATGDQVIEGEEFDILAIGDAYGNRGRLIEKALDAGRHIMGDKPLCTRPDECARIATKLRERGLAASLMLTFRYSPLFAALQKRLRDGVIGRLRTLHAFGPHPLSYGSRPEWYWTPRLHGGVLNDLMCHGLDAMRWFSGLELDEVLYAAVSNVAAPMVPEFEDNGQCLCLFEGGAKFGGEVSYLSPPKGQAIGWVLLGWGERGQFKLETRAGGLALDVAGEGPLEIEPEPLAQPTPIQDLVNYLETGETPALTTEDVIRTSEAILEVQAAAVRV
ncbi:MAG: Gfo/Idh/MocA family oxidoreductase [Armatimonadetes bacterium]|nr:Gfo/Idh/MocA family oxidoreductase [Armatimonadota bacterium]